MVAFIYLPWINSAVPCMPLSASKVSLHYVSSKLWYDKQCMENCSVTFMAKIYDYVTQCSTEEK